MKSLPFAVCLPSLVLVGALGSLGEEAAERDEVRAAVERALGPLQSSQRVWMEEIGCFSCHHEGLGALAVGVAREVGFAVDEELARQQAEAIHAESANRYEPLLVCDGVGVFGRGLILIGLGAHGRPKDLVTDAVAHFVAARQTVGGAWYANEHRAPFEDSHTTSTALAVRGLALYGPEGRAAEMEARLDRAREWFAAFEPVTTEDHSMRLWGLAWSGAPLESLARDVRALLELQREDGGWAQTRRMESDAYATGQALVALHQLGGLRAGEAAWERGVQFLLSDQRPDGTWFVATRRHLKGQPQRVSGFPYGIHQFVSFFASAWAAMALALDGQSGPTHTLLGPGPGRDVPAGQLEALGLAPLHAAAAFGSAAEVEALLACGDAPDVRGPRELTPLMLAVHDPLKVRLLIDHGADPHAVAGSWGFTPLLMAAITADAGPSLRLLLEHRVEVNPRAVNGANPLFGLASMTDTESFQLLLERGARFPLRYLDLAMNYAATCGDVEMGERLLEIGAKLDAISGTFKTTPLTSAVMSSYPDFVALMLEMGADPEVPCPEGLTALCWAAKVDPGHSEVLRLLLEAGADATATSDNGWTPLRWAEERGNAGHAQVLREHLKAYGLDH